MGVGRQLIKHAIYRMVISLPRSVAFTAVDCLKRMDGVDDGLFVQCIRRDYQGFPWLQFFARGICSCVLDMVGVGEKRIGGLI